MDKYVVAVSGGVDSMALLHMLANWDMGNGKWELGIKEKPKLIVGHFDHGIRPDSNLDAVFVETAAKNYGLRFELGQGRMGPGTSEDAARRARYNFLETMRAKHQAKAIITAHHQDDEIETAIINLLRGTGHRGLLPMRFNKQLSRPLLDMPKADIIKYAKSNELKWWEDSTNIDTSYLRNAVRSSIMPKLAVGLPVRENFLKLIRGSSQAGQQLEDELTILLVGQTEPASLERQLVNILPHAVGRELVAKWLRANGLKSFDKKTLERLTISAKTARPGSRQPAGQGHNVLISKTSLCLRPNG